MDVFSLNDFFKSLFDDFQWFGLFVAYTMSVLVQEKKKMNLLVVGRGVWYVTWKEGKVSKLKIFVLFWKNLFYDTLLHIPLEFHIRDA